jgi:hypothetical protein
MLREPRKAYASDFNGESDALSLDNTLPWGETFNGAETLSGPI